MIKKVQLFFCLLLPLLVLQSCIQDKCAGTICNNEGVCVVGVCSCPSGYEGNNCEKLWSDKFKGDWNVLVEQDSATHHYAMNIKSVLKDTFFIIGFADTLDTVYCVRKSNKEFDFIAKTFADTSLKLESGYGIINTGSTSVTGLYSFKIEDSVSTAKFTWTK